MTALGLDAPVLPFALMLLRTTVGALSGRWITVRVHRRRLLIVLLVLAVVALEVRQQLHADLLMAAWPG